MLGGCQVLQQWLWPDSFLWCYFQSQGVVLFAISYVSMWEDWCTNQHIYSNIHFSNLIQFPDCFQIRGCRTWALGEGYFQMELKCLHSMVGNFCLNFFLESL